ncbi:hypothetical protein PAAG_04419 [Paracoccidioides lutzii Pb01]|uniref:Uncharacterized protein n=1 Tax=Paracoccidioides lutzii (strain ATCC MYA-826 / Pb01) TaxID=502779 RepID=C1H0X5_PARBA|nr:hypothetical protein PAAG_04419 [Paracoccidioides lutzii Pb01]EEH33369.1 hypothetical protein PAAG_04419 [Paracoccidioides lutzii Pb01]
MSPRGEQRIRDSEQKQLVLPVIRPVAALSSDIIDPGLQMLGEKSTYVQREIESLVRTYNQSLKERKVFFVCETTDKPSLVTSNSLHSVQYDGTEAAGREFKVLAPFPTSHHVLDSTLIDNGITLSRLSCHRILDFEELQEILVFFHGAVNATALSTGCIIVKFPNKRAIQNCWAAKVAERVGQQIEMSSDAHNVDDIIYEFTSDDDAGSFDRRINRAVRLRFTGEEGIMVVVPQELIQPSGKWEVLRIFHNSISGLQKLIELLSIRVLLAVFCASVSTAVQNWWPAWLMPKTPTTHKNS